MTEAQEAATDQATYDEYAEIWRHRRWNGTPDKDAWYSMPLDERLRTLSIMRAADDRKRAHAEAWGAW